MAAAAAYAVAAVGALRTIVPVARALQPQAEPPWRAAREHPSHLNILLFIGECICSVRTGGMFACRMPRRLSARAPGALARSAPTAATAHAVAAAKVRCPPPLRGPVRVAPRQLQGLSVRRGAPSPVRGRCGCRAYWQPPIGAWYQRVSLSGPPQRRAAPRRLRCPPARGRTASVEASRRPGEVRGMRVPRCSGDAAVSTSMMCGIERAALRRCSFTCSSDSPGRGRTGLVCRPPRRLWGLAAITTDPTCTA